MNSQSALVLGIAVIIASIIFSLGSCSGSRTGRYQFQPTSGNNVFVLDTVTGQVWSKFVASTSGNSNWTEEKKVPWR